MTPRILLYALSGASVVAGCFAAYAIGVRLHDATRIENRRVIAEETTAFCEKYLNPTSSALFKQCSEDLTELRRRHEMRISDAFYSGTD